MKILKILTLRGPNYWANFPVLEAWIDLENLKDRSSEELPGFNERLTSWLPTMIEHRCSIGHRGGFFERLRRGTYLAHIMEHVALELQSLAGCEVGFGRTRETATDGIYKVALEYTEESLGKASISAAIRVCLAAVHDTTVDLTAEISELAKLYQNARLGPSTNSIVQAAQRRGIPSRRLNTGSLVQLGYGSKQRRILAAETDQTSAIAEYIAQDKDLTRSLLAAVGVPVPAGRPVESGEDAVSAAENIGYPVVCKPQHGNQGRGVATNLKTREQVLAAYEAARQEGRSIIVEKHAPGEDYRLLIIGGKLVAAAKREPAMVIGDGRHTIKELIQIANQDPRRGEDHATSLSKIPLDAISLAVVTDQGYTPQSIPAAGARVLIRRNANLSTGGTAADVTDLVHPQIIDRALEAARVIGLDIAGVDVVAEDIGRPLEEQAGVVVEVNAAPGLRMHLEPSSGTPRDVGAAIVDTMFTPGDTGRIPVIAITGVNGKTTTTRFIAHLAAATGGCVGMTCTDGIYVRGRRIDTGDCSGPTSAQNILLNPQVDIAVLETARGGILRAGLGFDRCDVAVVTNIGEGDHLGLHDIDSLEKLARVKRTIVEAVTPQTGHAVLNAADPLTVEMAEYCPGEVIFFAREAQHPVVEAHLQKKGRAVVTRQRSIYLCDGPREQKLLDLARVPLTHGGVVGFQVENTLAAAAAAWACGWNLNVIRRGLETFGADMTSSPGRFNLLDYNGATVIVDYGHNVSSLKSMLETLDQFPASRRITVYTAAGDRRDEDMIRQAELLGHAFDTVILYEDHYVRGREAGEITRLFQRGLALGSRVRDIREIRGAVTAVEAALAMAQPGDLLLIQADTIDETVAFMREKLLAPQHAREVVWRDIQPVGAEPGEVDSMEVNSVGQNSGKLALVNTYGNIRETGGERLAGIGAATQVDSELYGSVNTLPHSRAGNNPELSPVVD
ncbi:MAG: cyanophycin synthetase [Pirellulales bacterium]|nr:cyanophycin synthetase [Pirellulales bacterium]